MQTTGTSHFVNFTKACDYYKDYEPDATPAELERIVRRKIDEGQIDLGQPEIKQGETLSIIDDGCRYAITESEVAQ
jgi:hypothetical protein